MRYLVFGFLILFGLFHRITSSEFWPITISRTWLHPDRFEMSMLQKPLLTFVLSLFHIFSFSDVVHLILVKIFFATLGAAGVFALYYFVRRLAEPEKTFGFDAVALPALALFLMSPVFQTNYFSIRSDQMACVMFSFFLLFAERRNLRPALICLLIIPFMGIKEILFLIPGSVYFYFQFKSHFTRQVKIFVALGSGTALIWVLALNVSSVFYLSETFSKTELLSRYSSRSYIFEYPLLILSTLAAFYFIARKDKTFLPISVSSLLFLAILLALPQSFDFFIASVVPFIYIPLFLKGIQIYHSRPRLVLIAISAQLVFTASLKLYDNVPLYFSNSVQLSYIAKASALIHKNRLSYLDGEGILPTQTYLPCFASPMDSAANRGCLDMLSRNLPDVVIVTNRLMIVGDTVFEIVQKNYTQIYPNLFMKNEYVTEDVRSRINLGAEVGLPILIF
jgi:hypothetical protein